MALLSTVWYSLLASIGLTVRPETSSLVFIDPAQIIPSDIGCPDDTRCSIACQEDPRFKTKGSCVGPDRTLCSCEPPYDATEQPVNAEAKACNDQECKRKCAENPLPMIGKCIKGVCKCGFNARELQPAEAMDCNLDKCYYHCFVGLFPPLVYYCFDGICKCGWFF
ncbi:hypothetical protein AVEN_217370-1 [Araneus ventricosus]|uniref:TIL domain-containing protein n=1 Tax=Araneus ventricosus TaxID=182803 RepID=A0A4Y2HXS6_ARAVE|nr:hypothetical protein AVEN_217370-1 [Araneus ventricosus]